MVARRLCREDVLATLLQLFIDQSRPAHTRSDNGSEFIATANPEMAWAIVLGVVPVVTLQPFGRSRA